MKLIRKSNKKKTWSNSNNYSIHRIVITKWFILLRSFQANNYGVANNNPIAVTADCANYYTITHWALLSYETTELKNKVCNIPNILDYFGLWNNSNITLKQMCGKFVR